MTERAGVDYQPVALTIAKPMTIAKFRDLLAGLGAMASGHQFWIGDALVYGEEQFDEHDFHQAVADAITLEPHTITNYRWVAKSVEASRRREKLTWSHHAEVARLTPAQQERMLKQAEAKAWGVRELRDAIALKYPQSDREPAEPRTLTQADEALINRRLEGLDVALEKAREAGERWHEHITLEDVQWLHGLARTMLRGGKR